jgi:hypothetical protein
MVHRVLGIAPLPLSRRRDCTAANAPIHRRPQHLTGHRVRGEDLAFRPSDERICASGGIFQCAEDPAWAMSIEIERSTGVAVSAPMIAACNRITPGPASLTTWSFAPTSFTKAL